jgi:hypothetical protein
MYLFLGVCITCFFLSHYIELINTSINPDHKIISCIMAIAFSLLGLRLSLTGEYTIFQIIFLIIFLLKLNIISLEITKGRL